MNTLMRELAEANGLNTQMVEEAEIMVGFDLFDSEFNPVTAISRIREIRDCKDIALTNALLTCITADYAIRKELSTGHERWDEFMLDFDRNLLEYLHFDVTKATIKNIWH